MTAVDRMALDRLDAIIAAECSTGRPCEDLLAYLEGLRHKDPGAINRALDELEGEDEWDVS